MKIIAYRSSFIQYTRFGQGSRLVIGLPGYGNTLAAFNFLQPYISEECTLITLDYPYHGKTDWKEGLAFKPAELWEIIQAILQQEQITASTFTLFGYSMGGRLAMHLFQLHADKVDRLLLVAPDGMVVNFWYWLGTQSWLGNRLFRYTIRKPKWFLKLMSVANKMRIIDDSTYKMIDYNISNPDLSKELYNRWTCMRAFRPKLSQVQSSINQYKIPVKLLYGKFDRIISYKRGKKFQQGVKDLCELHIIENGHMLLQNPQAVLIKELLTK